jgi:hypothetical protein
MTDQRRFRRLILAPSGLVLSCVLAGILAFALRPPHFTTRIDAIGYTLTQHGAQYEQVYFDRSWSDQINASVYMAGLIVRTRKYGDVGGLYECHNGDRSCWVSVPKLNIDMAPVPDISRPIEHPLLAWLEARYAAVRAGKLPW